MVILVVDARNVDGRIRDQAICRGVFLACWRSVSGADALIVKSARAAALPG